MAISTCWLAGGSYLDVNNAYKWSAASIYRCWNIFLYAVNVYHCRTSYVVPQDSEEIDKAALVFAKRSTDNIIRGCVGALDGFLALINYPSMATSENNNNGVYYPGHYSCHELNPTSLWSTVSLYVFTTVAPGKSANQTAFERATLFQLVANLPTGCYLAADACTTMLVV